MSSTANYVRFQEGVGAFLGRSMTSDHIVKKRQVHYPEEFKLLFYLVF